MGCPTILFLLLLTCPLMDGKYNSQESTEKQDADQTDVMLQLQKLWKNQQKQAEEIELQIHHFNQENKQPVGELEMVKLQNQEQKQVNKEVMKELEAVKQHSRELEKQNDKLEQEVQQLKSVQGRREDKLRHSILESGKHHLTDDPASEASPQEEEHYQKYTNNFGELVASEKSTRSISERVNASIGFTAGGVLADIVYEDGEIIIFDVVQQETPQYDPATSVFTCDQAGLYYFSAHITFRFIPAGNRYQYIYMFHNAARVTSTFADFGDIYPLDYTLSSTSAVIYLQEGDQVFLQANGRTRLRSHVQQSSFSGFLISAM